MQGAGASSGKTKRAALRSASAWLLGQALRAALVTLATLVALAAGGYMAFESIVEAVDAVYWREVDAHLGIDKRAVSRLRNPAYFAQQSTLVTEDRWDPLESTCRHASLSIL